MFSYRILAQYHCHGRKHNNPFHVYDADQPREIFQQKQRTFLEPVEVHLP
jgi:hypothetical protein